MYDRAWARSVHSAYAKLCTRAQQIDICIQQNIAELYSSEPRRIQVVDVLVSSIQGKVDKKIWTSYKRLCKVSPLDKNLLMAVSYQVWKNITDEDKQLTLFEIDVDKKLRQSTRS